MREHGDSYEINYGAIRIEPTAHTVLVQGVPVHLAQMEYRLLIYLLQHIGETLARQDILSEVWGTPATLKTRTVDIHVSTIRKKLLLDKDLETIMGVGYRLRTRREERLKS